MTAILFPDCLGTIEKEVVVHRFSSEFDMFAFVICETKSVYHRPDRSVADRFVYTEKVGGSKPSWDIMCVDIKAASIAYLAERSKALDLRSIVHLYAQVRTLQYALHHCFCLSVLWIITMASVILLRRKAYL